MVDIYGSENHKKVSNKPYHVKELLKRDVITIGN